jgi:mRNA degradation ribonuclease J1/J2
LESGEPIEESFLGATTDTWDDAAGRYPETVAPSGHWRLHVHCFALRSEGRTIVVDTGFGPVTAPAFAWAQQPGRLPVELAEAGIEAGEVDTVIITHVHDDHLGWTVFDGGRTLHSRTPGTSSSARTGTGWRPVKTPRTSRSSPSS